MIHCQHRREREASLIRSGVETTIYRCSKMGRCTDTEEMRQSLPDPSLVFACESCPFLPFRKKPVMSGRPKGRFCYVTGSDRETEHEIVETMIASARAVGVMEDFHAFCPREAAGAINHVGRPSFDRYHFKLELLRQVKDLDYDYLVWIDPDSYFVRDPGDLSGLLRDEPVWVPMEGELTSHLVRHKEWWGIPIRHLIDLCRHYGIRGETVWNTNAGMMIVRRESAEQFIEQSYRIRADLASRGYANVTEEPTWAIAGQLMMRQPELSSRDHWKDLWDSDWTALWKRKRELPTGLPWKQTDWMTGQDLGDSNPAIVHLMQGKVLMRKTSERRRPLPEVRLESAGQFLGQAVMKGRTSVTVDTEPVGTVLHRLLAELGQSPAPGCDCNEWIVQMNLWGIDGCRANRTWIVMKLKNSAMRVVKSKWTGWLDVAKVALRGYLTVESIVDEALRRSEMFRRPKTVMMEKQT